MNPEILTAVAITLLLSGAGGYLLAYTIQRSRRKNETALWAERRQWLDARLDELKQEVEGKDGLLARITREKQEIELELARLQTLNHELKTRLEQQRMEWEKSGKELQVRFENLANKIFEEKGNRFTEQNKQQLHAILEPLGEKIRIFEKQVQDTQKEQIGMHAQLREQLKTLRDQNIRISQEAENLTRALKGDNKTQGNWGELVLEKVLEKSGLEKDREYSVQQSFRNEEGQRQLPDVIVHLPDGKKMVIDSKVSLSAYERLVNSQDQPERQTAAREHLDSLKRHIQQLSSKKYEDIYAMESPDFVLMFVPIEPAFAAALQEDPSLFSHAFDRNIVLVTPTTLLATLKTIDSMWTNEKQRQNALEIARVAGGMYDKFVGFCENLEQVGRRIDASRQEYETAMNRLRDGKGNLISSAERLKKLGAKAKKSQSDSILGESNLNLNSSEF